MSCTFLKSGNSLRKWRTTCSLNCIWVSCHDRMRSWIKGLLGSDWIWEFCELLWSLTHYTHCHLRLSLKFQTHHVLEQKSRKTTGQKKQQTLTLWCCPWRKKWMVIQNGSSAGTWLMRWNKKRCKQYSINDHNNNPHRNRAEKTDATLVLESTKYGSMFWTPSPAVKSWMDR